MRFDAILGRWFYSINALYWGKSGCVGRLRFFRGHINGEKATQKDAFG